MGVKLKDLVHTEEVSFRDLQGKVLAVDALNTIFQFLSVIRRRDGTLLRNQDGDVTSHLSGLFYRNANLIKEGVRPVYVFDGVAPEAKEKTSRKRKERKKKAEEKLEEARERGDADAIRRYAMQTAKVNDKMLESAKELLEAMGIPVVQAPGEGEAQAARMCREKKVWAVASQDYDGLMFGSPCLLRNLNITGRRKVPGKNRYYTINPELIRLKNVLEELNITQEQLIKLGILIGTDYNPGGIKGIGPKRGLKAVREGKFEELYPDADWLVELFTEPDVDDVKIEWPEFDREKIEEIMYDQAGFSEKRVASTLDEAAEEASERQQGLGEFM